MKSRRIVTILLAITMLFPLQVFSKNETQKLTSYEVGLIENQITTSTFSNRIERTLNVAETKKLIIDLKNKGIQENDIYYEIFVNLGYSQAEIDNIGYIELEYLMVNAQSITTNEVYILNNPDGSTIEMSKNDCLDAILHSTNLEISNNMESNINTLSTLSNNASNTEIKNYIKIITTSTYIDPSVAGGVGWYVLSGSFTFLTMPTFRRVDAFSIYGQGTAISQTSGDIYSTASYDKKTTDITPTGATTIVDTHYWGQKNSTDRSLNSGGVYYKWDLPDDVYTSINGYTHRETISNLSYYIRVKARVSLYTLPSSFNVFTRYSHSSLVLNITPSFGWTTSPGGHFGVSVVAVPSSQYTNSESFNLTNYIP